MRNTAEVNIAVVSLSNTQPPKPAQPPPQLSGAMIIQTAEMAMKIIANFFHALNTCSLRKSRIILIGKSAKEKTNNEVPTGLNILLIYTYINKIKKTKMLTIRYCLCFIFIYTYYNTLSLICSTINISLWASSVEILCLSPLFRFLRL